MEPLPGSDDHALQFLATEGYLPFALGDHPGLVSAFKSLFEHTSDFFALPEDDAQKTAFQAKSGPAASEEGYSKIPDEKCIATVKIADHCPESLRDPVEEVWRLSGAFMKTIMEAIAATLHLDPKVFAPFVEPCINLPRDERTPTLLRMFRYDRPPGPDPVVNAERHRDLGILSLVVGHSPGLFALSPSSERWIPVEEDAVLPAGTKARSGGLTATLLGGETLAFLTRGAYKAGVHGVVCMPPEEGANGGDPFRYSVVYTLRPAVAPVHTKNFESDVVGSFPPEQQVDGESSEELFGKIKKTHYNVNVAPEIREKQKMNQAAAVSETDGNKNEGKGKGKGKEVDRGQG